MYKVIIASAIGSGKLGETLSEPIIGNPGVGHTEIFISIGAFDSIFEAKALEKYVKTKFSRIMLGILKVTQNGPISVWRMVPIQNFTPSSFIDWEKDIDEIDMQLFKKYNLTDQEISFINNHAVRRN